MNTPEKCGKYIVKQKDACIVAYTIRDFSINGLKTWGKLRIRRVNGEEFRTVEFPCDQIWALNCTHDLMFVDKKMKLDDGTRKHIRCASGSINRK